MKKMISRERMKIACRCGKTDHVPLYFRVFDFTPPKDLTWKDQFERAETWLSMGLDDILYIESPLIRDGFGGLGNPVLYHPDVKVRSGLINDPNERYPIIIQE